MAKLKAPLLSLGAAGAIGKSLVFFNWKGLDVVREYVIPTNPKSDDQVAQRNKLTAGVTDWHSTLLTDADRAAWKLQASVFAIPMTAFNAFVKMVIRVMLADLTHLLLYELTATRTADTTATVTVKAASELPSGHCWYGETKSALYIDKPATYADSTWTASLTGLTKNKKYFAKFSHGGAGQGGDSGIIEIPATA